MTRSTRFGDERGSVLLLTAFAMVALLGIAALSLDASFMYDKRNRLHAAADAAAKSGAIEVRRNASISSTDLQTFADAAVTRHGFTPGVATTVTVYHAPVSGPFAGNANYVEVIVSEPTSTFLGAILGLANMTPTARAVAGTSPGENCIITLGGTSASPVSIDIGNSVLTMPGCNVASAGNMNADNPNTSILAGGTSLVGTCSGSAACDDPTKMPNLTEGSVPPTDPLSGLAAPTNPGGCGPNPAAVGGVITLVAGNCYSSVDLPTNTTLNITGTGVLYLTGPFIAHNNTVVNGTGVMFYMAGTAATADCTSAAPAACFSIGNSATFNLSAPTSGPYSGILMFQPATNHLDAEFDGNNPSYNLSGAMYFPGADVSFRNGIGASNDCMLFVARSLHIDNGNGSFSNVCSAYGGSPILTVSMAE